MVNNIIKNTYDFADINIEINNHRFKFKLNYDKKYI